MARNGNNPVYAPNGKAGEYAKWAANFYIGCSNDCEYCYCKRGVLGHAMGGTTPTLKKCFKDDEDALRRFKANVQKYLPELRKHGIFFTFTSDPMLKQTRDLHWSAALYAVEQGVNVKFLTKRADFITALHVDECSEEQKRRIAWGFTLTGCDDKEPNASTNRQRINAMRRLHKMGFKTFASIEPIISIARSHCMISEALPFCDLFKIGLLSGKREYTPEQVKAFVCQKMADLAMYKYPAKVYWKDSVFEYIGMSREELQTQYSELAVGADYDLFGDN